jgi:hypothetical protein
MEHLSDIALIELAAGRADAETQRAAEAHLAACPECAARLAATARTWQVLGEWQVTAPEWSAERIVAAARRLPPASPWRPLLRVAAAIVLAAGIGHAAARWGWPLAAPSHRSAPDESAREAATMALSLDVLAQQSAGGLAEAVLDLGAAPEEAQP